MYTCCIVYIMCRILLYISYTLFFTQLKARMQYIAPFLPYITLCNKRLSHPVHYTLYTIILHNINSQEVYKHGMVEANFSPQNKLLRLEMAFDVMSFMQQLRRSSGRYDFQVCSV